ncbi:MAG: RNA pseudouridine synthase [Elusimicrobia bacterium]|nr:RNA pseudouridine synthase [Elusimicrobiota bacterium]
MTNEGFEYRERLGPESAGKDLLGYLRGRYPHSTAAQWRERIVSGLVLLDGRKADIVSPLSPGQVLTWQRPPWVEPEAPTSFATLYEDEDLLAAAKPAGLPVLPGAGYLRNTLLSLVRRRFPGASPLHRLGRWTSGVVLFARTRQARSSLTRQWEEREVGKLYRALAVGAPGQDEFEVAAPIGPVPHPTLKTVHAASAAGKPAHSRVTVVERRAGAFLCDVRIATGRPHQIRIHLAAAGHPLAGDPLYAPGGGLIPGTRAGPGDPGYLLHAAELRFRHPRDGRETVVPCPPPPGLAILRPAVLS